MDRYLQLCNNNSRKRKLSQLDGSFNSTINSLDENDKLNAKVVWKNIVKDGLNIKFLSNFMDPTTSIQYLEQLDNEITYFTGNLAKVRVFGNWYDLPRQQAAYGDEGLKYSYSGCTVPAMPWTPTILMIKSMLEEIVPYKYNFCLVNKYRNGSDYIGEHRDDERELDKSIPIASVSLGQSRDFIFRHKNTRGKCINYNFEPLKIILNNGSLLLMNPPTNTYWYHSLPKRKKLLGTRINLTFRKIVR